MGNTEPVFYSRFADDNQWLTVAQSGRKHLIQNKLSRQIVEKHFLQNVSWSEVKQDSIIYQWRKEPKNTLCSVQLFEVRKITQQEEQINCMNACSGGDNQSDLLVYTEHIHKLYEHNPKISLTEREQVVIFLGIIEGVDLLSMKFGEFGLAKDMIGFNSTKQGKAWIHENYCINSTQIKRQILDGDQRIYWEKEVIDSLVGIAKLSSVDRSVQKSKFFYPIEYILRNKLFTFQAIKDSPEFRGINLSQIHRECLAARAQQLSKDVELSTSRRYSNELVSTEDRQRVKIFNQTFDTPYEVYQVPNRDRTMLEQQMMFREPENPQIRINPVQYQNKHNHLQSRPMETHNESTLNDALDYNRKHPENRHQHPLYQIRERPAHYALLDQLQNSRSSRASSKMIDKDHIKMVDSWVMVEKGQESESSHPKYRHRNKKGVVLEESIIMKAPRI